VTVKIKVQNFQSIEDAEIVVKGFTVITGTNNGGKALAHGTQVATPNGWQPVESLVVGDSIISGDGSCTIITGVFPQGLRPAWEILFDDGRKVIVDEEHLWRVSFGNNRFPDYKWQDLTTKQIIDAVTINPVGGNRPAIPVAGPAQYLSQSIPLDPYLIGVLLGDGSLKHNSTRFSTADDEILDSVRSILPDGVRVTSSPNDKYNYRISARNRWKDNPVNRALDDLGVTVGSSEKFIPSIYKYNNPEVRLGVLQGLMDTDGFISKDGKKVYYTTSSKLAVDVIEVVRSLGGKVTSTIKKHPYYKKKGKKYSGRPCYNLYIHLGSVDLFRLSRKLCRVRPVVRRDNPLMVSFLKLEKLVKCTCLTVDHPSELFQVNDHIVTHNSALMRATRGTFQNTRGSAFVRNGAAKSMVTVDLGDHTVYWEKGLKSKPTYIVDQSNPIHPGQAVPTEVSDLGICPIQAGNRELWPQFANQFTGQLFLLDQPGSVLAEAVADVDRVTQLNQALRLSESDRRSANSELKIRRGDKEKLEDNLQRFEGIDDVIVIVETLEADAVNITRIESALIGVRELRARYAEAIDEVARLEGIENLDVPDTGELDNAGGALDEMEIITTLHERFVKVSNTVEYLTGIEKIEIPEDKEMGVLDNLLDSVDIIQVLHDRYRKASGEVSLLTGIDVISLGDMDMTKAEQILMAIGLTKGLSSQYDMAVANIMGLEAESVKIDDEVIKAQNAVTDYLKEIGQCPVCDSNIV